MSHYTGFQQQELAHGETSNSSTEHPPTYHEARSESTPPSYPPSLVPHAKPERRQSQLEELMEFKAQQELTMSNYGAIKGVATGPAKDPVALFRWIGKKISGDKGESWKDRKARIQREWEDDMKASNGIKHGDMDTSVIA
jgi:hypothetical protein